MPGHDWDQYRRLGQKPVARGIVYLQILDYLKLVVPDIAPALVSQLPDGAVRVIVFTAGGASVYFIEPAPQSKLN